MGNATSVEHLRNKWVTYDRDVQSYGDFHAVPEDFWGELASWLPMKDICRLSCTSMSLRNVADHNDIWQPLMYSSFHCYLSIRSTSMFSTLSKLLTGGDDRNYKRAYSIISTVTRLQTRSAHQTVLLRGDRYSGKSTLLRSVLYRLYPEMARREDPAVLKRRLLAYVVSETDKLLHDGEAPDMISDRQSRRLRQLLAEADGIWTPEIVELVKVVWQTRLDTIFAWHEPALHTLRYYPIYTPLNVVARIDEICEPHYTLTHHDILCMYTRTEEIEESEFLYDPIRVLVREAAEENCEYVKKERLFQSVQTTILVVSLANLKALDYAFRSFRTIMIDASFMECTHIVVLNKYDVFKHTSITFLADQLTEHFNLQGRVFTHASLLDIIRQRFVTMAKSRSLRVSVVCMSALDEVAATDFWDRHVWRSSLRALLKPHGMDVEFSQQPLAPSS
eukprot:GILK01008590.1.p1 GENE.GILK01008590.1~~GILK01008590.1.p1  ORF type:complete len:448 (-),score=52.01 GILK01008590.1:215-1558(-)